MSTWILAVVLIVAAVAPAWLYWRHALRASHARRDAIAGRRRARVGGGWPADEDVVVAVHEAGEDPLTAIADDIDAEAHALWLAYRRATH